jgi:hypothetical protein
MPNLLDEELVPFAEGIRSLPGRPHVSTGYRYLFRGCHGIRLETIVVFGRRFTSRQALRRFVAATTAAANGEALPKTSPTHQGPDDERIKHELDAAGL